MDYIETGAQEGGLIPVLLGLSPQTHALAHRIFRERSTVSHVFCEKRPFTAPLSICAKFHAVPHTANDRLMVEALCSFAAQYQNADVILYLIPCTEHYINTLWYHAAELESHFVIGSAPAFGESLLSIGTLKGEDA